MQNNELILSERKRDLLLSVVENYIETASPITSEKVHDCMCSNLSSATLRNELNALEQMGFLKQLHTSGGRIPTTNAYRYYVNALITTHELDASVLGEIKDKFLTRTAFLGEMLDHVAKSISEITNYPTVVHISGYQELKLLGINIIPLLTGQGLVLIKTDAGVISNNMTLNKSITEENCKDASKFLTTNLYNKKVVDVVNNIELYNNLMKNQIKFYKELFISLTEILKDYCEHGTSVVKNGNPSKMFEHPEYRDVDSAKKFLNFIENEEQLKDIMENIDKNTENDIVFSIGEENQNDTLNDYSIIKANYALSDGITASIGVVGFKRMDYAKIASALKYVIDEMRQTVNETKKGEQQKHEQT